MADISRIPRAVIRIAMHAINRQHVIDIQDEKRGGEHRTLWNASVNGHGIRTVTVYNDRDAPPIQKASDPLAETLGDSVRW